MHRPNFRANAFIDLGNSGLTILEVMIAAAIMLVMMLALLTMSDSQMKEAKAVYQKTELTELRNQLRQIFANRDVCTWQLVGSPTNTIDTTNDPAQSSTVIPLSTLYQGLDSSSTVIANTGLPLPLSSSGLVVSNIQFTDIKASGLAGQYQGNIEIQFQPNSLASPLRPVRFLQTVQVDLLNGTPTARPILYCTAGCEPDTLDTGFSCVARDSDDLLGYAVAGAISPFSLSQTAAILFCNDFGRRPADLNDLVALCKIQPSGPTTGGRFWFNGAKSAATGCNITLNAMAENNNRVLCAYTKTAPL